MPRRLLTLRSESQSLTRLTRQLDQYASELGTQGVEAYKETLNEYKFKMRDRSSIGPLYKKTGRLRGSWDFEVVGGQGTIDKLRGSVYSHAGYSIIHEEGGVIRPNSSRSWIYIPTHWNMKENGTAAKTPTTVINEGGKYISRFNMDIAILEETRLADGWISNSMLCDNQGWPMFFLVKSASYEAKLGTREQMPVYTEKLVQRLADRALIPLKD